jgi:mRNA-degrading endonuclease RelE of RelBE toxin-antitoxin system
VSSERYEIRFQPAARRAIAERLPESVAAAVLEFCEAALALSPRRVGKPLFGPLAGCYGARRGTYRIVYRIDEQAHAVQVLDIDHRADIYHRPLRLSGAKVWLNIRRGPCRTGCGCRKHVPPGRMLLRLAPRLPGRGMIFGLWA